MGAAELVRMAHLAGVPLETQADYSAARVVLAKEFAPELEFLRAMPHIYVNQDYLFVHGGVPREERLEELDAYGCMKNDDFMGQGHSFKRWVIVGHWPVTLYHAHIPSSAPLFCRERKIISIDGACGRSRGRSSSRRGWKSNIHSNPLSLYFIPLYPIIAHNTSP